MKKSGGIVIKKKNSFQKHKNAEAERKKAQEEEEAKVLAEFEDTFGAAPEQAEDTKPQRPKPGPRAIMPRTGMGMGMGRPPQPSGGTRQAPGMAEASQAPSQRTAELPASKGGTRQIDLLTEKLKGEKTVREDRMRVLGAVGMGHLMAHESESDNNSTNLYVTNLYRTVTEDILMETFGRYGPLASVKVMWPRNEEERATKMHNSGFVGFMARRHAEAAVENLHGSILHGAELKVGYGKSIPIPPQPIYPRPQHMQQLHNHMASVSHGVANSVNRKTWGRGEVDEKVIHRGCGKDIHVEFPKEERVRFVIDTLARFIIEDGTDMEQILLEAEASNPEFEFLRNVHCPEHTYYRWKLYSLCNEDTMAAWRTDPFVMIEESNRIHPPPLHSKSFQKETAAQRGGERERDMQLSDLERERLEDMLRQLKVERANIQAAMVFALDHASCAPEISDCLIASLTLAETPLHLKIARLYLASDVLHNSTVPVRNASRYRQLLQAELPSVFQSFHEALLSAEAALKREAFKRNSLRVLRVWRDWYLFSEDYLNGLQATFLMDTDSKWRGLCPDQLKEWTEMAEDDLERTCRMMGVMYASESKDVCLDRLVMQNIFSLFGVHGPPASVLEALVSSKHEDSGTKQSAPMPATKLGLLAAYESDSEGEEGTKAGNSDQAKASKVSTSRWATDHDVQLTDADIQEKAQQWEQIEEEAQATDEKPLSQWLLEKQAQAAAEAEAQRREEAAHRAQMQHEAQERLQQLEEEERQAEEKYRAGLDLEEGEAIPDRAARRSLEQQRLQQSHGPWEEMEKSYHNEGNAPGPAANVAGLISDGHRKQLREVELRVVELQEELLEEEGWQVEEVHKRCNELRTLLLARVESGDLLDSDDSRSKTRQEDLNWALQNSTSKQSDAVQDRHLGNGLDGRGGAGKGNAELRDGSDRDSARGRRRRSSSPERSAKNSDRERDRGDRDRGEWRKDTWDSRSGSHRTSDDSSRRRGADKAEESQRSARYRRDGGAEERQSDGKYSRSQRDDGDRYRRDGDRSKSRGRGRERDSDRGHSSWEDDRDSKRVRRR